MRRIIERVVTVVTTTTWTISWQDDSIQSNLQPDPVARDLSQPQPSPHAQRSNQAEMIKSAKEVDPSETEK